VSGAEVDDAAALEELSRRVNRLALLSRYPERFHEERDAIARELARIAGRLRRGPGPHPEHVWRPPA